VVCDNRWDNVFDGVGREGGWQTNTITLMALAGMTRDQASSTHRRKAITHATYSKDMFGSARVIF
jgi:hypothetical protein